MGRNILFINKFLPKLFGDAVKRNRSSIFGVLAIILFFLFTPSFIDYQELIEADFLSTGEDFEDPDIGDFSLDKQLDFAVEISPLSIFSLRENNLFDSLTGLALQISPSNQKLFTLRC
jgi:hypothetical protein